MLDKEKVDIKSDLYSVESAERFQFVFLCIFKRGFGLRLVRFSVICSRRFFAMFRFFGVKRRSETIVRALQLTLLRDERRI